MAADKSDGAFLTIGELAAELGLAHHILRYWETRFPQLRPLQRAGNRRYYRPDDVALARRIDRLLNHEGYTVKGVQKVLEDGIMPDAPIEQAGAVPVGIAPPAPAHAPDLSALVAIRAMLSQALDEDEAAWDAVVTATFT